MNKFSKPFWLLSFFLTSVIFIYTYANMDDMVSYYQNPYTLSKLYISRELFFFIGLSTIIVTNLALYVFSKLIRDSHVAKEYFKELGTWFITMAGISNIFLFVSLVFILLFNRLDDFDPRVLGFFLYFIGFIAFAWLVRLIILLLKRQQ